MDFPAKKIQKTGIPRKTEKVTFLFIQRSLTLEQLVKLVLHSLFISKWIQKLISSQLLQANAFDLSGRYSDIQNSLISANLEEKFH